MKKKSKILLTIIVLAVVIAGGFFYWWLSQPVEESEEKTQPPTLFGKEDYKIEERADGKFIAVEKVGLSCEVPEGWRIEKVRGSGYPESGFWVDLYSSDAEIFDILTKGCGISIMAGTAEKSAKEIKENIRFIQETPEKSDEIRKDYEFEVIEINNYQGLEWIEPEVPDIGQATGIDIPIGDDKLISIGARFPSGYKEKCSPIWEDFLRNVVIE